MCPLDAPVVDKHDKVPSGVPFQRRKHDAVPSFKYWYKKTFCALVTRPQTYSALFVSTTGEHQPFSGVCNEDLNNDSRSCGVWLS